jgi:hypothetical protein
MYRAWSAWCCASEENNRATSVGDFTSSLQAQELEAVVHLCPRRFRRGNRRPLEGSIVSSERNFGGYIAVLGSYLAAPRTVNPDDASAPVRPDTMPS